MGVAISIVSTKGGAGKTTLAFLTGHELADRDYRVLLVDTDPQASLTKVLIRDSGARFRGTRHDIALLFREDAEEFPEPVKVRENLYLLPAYSEYLPVKTPGVEFALYNAVNGSPLVGEGYRSHYDFIIIDSIGFAEDFISVMAYLAGDYWLVPFRPNVLDRTGMGETFRYMQVLRRRYAHTVKARFLGVVIQDFSRSKKWQMDIVEDFVRNFPSFVREKLTFLDVVSYDNLILAQFPSRVIIDKLFETGKDLRSYVRETGERTDLVDLVRDYVDRLLKLTVVPAGQEG